VRENFHESLDTITDELVAMAQQVAVMLHEASQALLTADRERAEAVIAADEEVDTLHQELELRTTELIALQQPVAVDLRLIVASMRISATLERMGDLAQHVAKAARLRHPDSAVPAPQVEQFRAMAALADDMVAKMVRVLATRDVHLAIEVDHEDDQMDQLHREVLEGLLRSESPVSVNEAVDATLLNRYYERLGDHAVSVCRRVIYLVIGDREQ